jgi:hypothetical protein
MHYRRSLHRPDWPLIALLCSTVAVLPVLLLPDPARGQGDKDRHESKVVLIESPDLLKVPSGVDMKGQDLAKTPPKVQLAFFAGLKDRGKGTLWSNWGDGCLASNGKYYTSIGDHLGKDATSYVYEYDPATLILRRIVDVMQAIGQALGLFGHGKIHAGIHEGADGWLYFATYWGKPKEVDAAFEKGYPGSLLLRYDPRSGRTESLGAPVPKQGLPASHFDRQRGLLYFHAVYKGNVAVYDLNARKLKFLGGGDESAAQRTFLSDRSGRVYFSAVDGTLSYYDPQTNQLGKTKVRLPASPGAKKAETGKADSLRAASRPGKDGVVYGMTQAGRLFSFDPEKLVVKDLGPNFGKGEYTAVMVLSPDEKYLYYAPGAHGSGNKSGTPVLQYEIATGRRKVLAFLAGPLEQKYGYRIGGTYNLQIDATGERLFFTFNGAPVSDRGTFGQPCVAVVQVPRSER